MAGGSLGPDPVPPWVDPASYRLDLRGAGADGWRRRRGPSSSSHRSAVNPSGYLLGTDFIANNQVPGIDFATLHSYPDQWLPSLDNREAGYSGAQGDAVFATVYGKVYDSARAGGPAAGALFWQLLADGMDSYGDGYEVVLGRAPSTTGVITTQSRRLQGLVRAFVRARKAQRAQGKGRQLKVTG